MLRIERTPDQWFQEAARWYVEGHQGCPWCCGAHCVHEVKLPRRVDYCCTICDFQATHEPESGQFFSIPGEKPARKRVDTMFDA